MGRTAPDGRYWPKRSLCGILIGARIPHNGEKALEGGALLHEKDLTPAARYPILEEVADRQFPDGMTADDQAAEPQRAETGKKEDRTWNSA